ncbi:MAG TPA: porin family protein [Flavobacteriaceae bacterium]|nr:porin family protein [Flavobacteriaceae bacterium]
MKRLILMTCGIFLALSLNAQEIDLGIKAGANFANITDASNLDNKTGFLGGAFFAIKFNKMAIQPELLYSQQGAKFDAGDFDLTYVNVPIILKYYLIQGLNIQIGPQFGFVVKDDISEVFSGIGEGIESNDFDVAGAIGLGYDFPFGLRLDARYNYGFTDVMDGGEGKNSVVSLAVGFSFL